jgi:hypothetical protein
MVMVSGSHNSKQIGIGWKEKNNLAPDNAAEVPLTKTLDEKRENLKRSGDKFYTSLELHDGFTCLNVWKNKTEGEFGPLSRTVHPKAKP